MLPDSSSDPKGSIGFVQYKIKPYNALVKGNKIKNTAYIYFDYNPAIVTNTTQNECVQANNSSINHLLNYSFKIYPNPNNGQFIIENNIYIPNQQYLIYDVYGKLVKSIAIKLPKMNVDLSEFANGIYFIKLNSKEINNSLIIVKE